MESKESSRIQEKFILRALDKLGEGSQLLWIVLAVCVSVSLINALHTMSYIFIAEVPNYWCAIPELTNANWTDEQIKNISIINGCHKYDYNYTYLASLGYEEATDYVKNNEFNTSVVSCSSFVFDKSGRSTIVNEWQLVCDKKVYRANTFLAYALGKLLGDLILGIYSDKYGRKRALIIGLVLQIVFVFSSGLVPWFWAYVVSKFFVGASISSMYSTAYTILSEVAKNHKKNLIGTVMDTMFPIGTLVLIGIAYFVLDWRYLQLSLSLFSFLAVIVIWFVPESPRWLMSQNRHDETKKIVEKYYKAINKPTLITESPTPSLRFESPDMKTNRKKGFKRYFGKSKILFSDPVLRNKLLIMYFAFFVTLSVGYCLIFTIDLFETDRYIYSLIAASIELIALLSIPVVLLKLSCQKASCLIYMLASICMLSIIAVPKENINVIMGLTMVAKFCLITSFTVNMLLASELFPIAVRNTALGTILVMAQLGSMTAPYIIDFLSQVAWWAPTTLCGASSLIAGLLCLIIPT